MINLNIRFISIPLLSLTTILLLTACPDNPPTHHRDSTIHLSVVNEGTFSVRLKVSVKDSSDAWSFALNRDDSTVATVSATGADTTLRDGGLLPGHTYRYRAYWLDGGDATDSSEEVTATTMDTTSHNFTWVIDTLGNYGSYLNDVAIVNDDNIWVVGYITTDTATYNAAHWDGNEWELILIDRIVDFDGVYAFNDNEIWFSDGCFIYLYEGNSFIKMWECDWQSFGPGQANRIWGSSPDDIYFVGDNGSIVHYDGSTFRRMESGHDVRLIDVSGTPDGEYVYVVGMDFFSPAYSSIYQIHNGEVETLFYQEFTLPHDDTDLGVVSSVSVNGDTAYFVTYRGLLKRNTYTGESKIDHAFSNYDYRNLVVQNSNDIFAMGGGGTYVHFNGSTWDLNDDLYPDENLSSWGSAFNGNTIVLTGYFRDGSHGYVAIGRR